MDVNELIHATSQIQHLLTRCVTDYGDLKRIDPKVVENVYVSICKYERKIQILQKQGALAKIISQARLRGKIDQLSTRICVQVEEMEKEIKSSVIKRVVENYAEEVFNKHLMLSINDQKPDEMDLRRSSDTLRDSHDAEKKLTDKETKTRIENMLSIISDQKRREKILR